VIITIADLINPNLAKNADIARAKNREVISRGVAGLKCVDLRWATEQDFELVAQYIPKGYVLSTVEEYECDAKIMYLRKVRDGVVDKTAMKIVRVLPE
jgi:hypothetical protein